MPHLYNDELWGVGYADQEGIQDAENLMHHFSRGRNDEGP